MSRRLAYRAGFLCVAAATAFSQLSPGTITGAIAGPDGDVFPIAFVQLKNTQTAAVLNTAANGGKYDIASVAPGTYQLSVSVPGMKSYRREGIEVRPGQTLRIDVRLEDSPSLRTLGEDPAGLAAAFINRPPPPEGPTPRAADGRPDFSGMWLSGPAEPEVDMLPWAKALTDERGADNSKEYPPSHCLPGGPAPLLSAGFFKLVQTPALLMMLFEGETPGYRQVFLDGRDHPKDFGPTWLGHSTGKWESDTLVIDSVGFRDKGWMDFEGHPHTDAVHVIQRMSRPDLGHLEIQITVDDAGAYRKPWTAGKTASLVLNDEIQESICNENNLDADHLVGK